MAWLVPLLLVVVGVAALALGAEWLVRGGASLARSLGISAMAVGVTVIAYGTSAPEMVAGVAAAAQGHTDVTLGTAVGSNIANIGLILGVTALVRPFTVRLRMLAWQLILMLAATGVFAWLALNRGLGRVTGACFLGGLVMFTLASLWQARKESRAVKAEFASYEEAAATSRPSLVRDVLLLLAGLFLLAAGGSLLVKGAVALARQASLGEALIGATLVAVGTSLPELSTSIVAALRREPDICLGNLVGSNIFNILGALGLGALIRPIPVPPSFLRLEIPALVVFSLAMVAALVRDRRVTRWEGGLLLAAYAVFTLLLFGGFRP